MQYLPAQSSFVWRIKQLNGGGGADDAVAAGKSLSRAEVVEMAIEAIATVYSQDFKANELEIGIVSTAPEEPEETRGKWRTMGVPEIEEHLLAYAEKD